MKKNILFNKEIWGLFIFILLLSSCDRTKIGKFVGPSLCPTENFSYIDPLQSSTTNAIFTNGDVVNITATLNETLSWKIKIIGLTSGATKSYEGASSSVNISWRGKPDAESVFFVNEDCSVEYTLACSEKKTILVNIQPNDFMNVGLMMSNFDGAGSGTFSNPPYGLYRDLANSGIRNAPVSPSPQGGNYYSIVGDVGTADPTWFFGGTSISSGIASLTETDPENIYFNIFINSNGKKNSYISFSFIESGVTKTYGVTADWDGWKMVSFKLSEAGIIDPQSVGALDIGLGSSPQKGTTAELNFDMPIVTTGSPFYE